MISKILIGTTAANTYPNMHEVLRRLGITNGYDLQHHFHIYLNPPDAEPIGTQNLLAVALTVSLNNTPLPDASLQTEVQELLDYAQTIIEGEELMFIMDVPSVPVPQTPIVLAQTATPAAPQPDYLLKYCAEKASTGDTRYLMNGINPAGGLKNFLQNRDKEYVDMAAIKITLLEGTKHGELEGEFVSGVLAFMYDPIEGYVGKDKAIFMAEFEGKRYKIIVELHVFDVAPSEYLPSSCPEPQLIKVKRKPVSGSSGSSGYDSGYSFGSLSITFADLEGAAIGQTTGSTITLDTNAANYNWYIDPTPGQNEEYLPTSNPNEWVAKAGSEAYGKMDMLSVLLHEYGHTLGINHSPDPNDYMGTTLTAGVRRLPSAEEMVLMQGLVAQAKASLTPTRDNSLSTLTPTLSQWERELSRAGVREEREQTPAPFPTLPLGTSFIGFLGLLRSNRYGGLNIVPDEGNDHGNDHGVLPFAPLQSQQVQTAIARARKQLGA